MALCILNSETKTEVLLAHKVVTTKVFVVKRESTNIAASNNLSQMSVNETLNLQSLAAQLNIASPSAESTIQTDWANQNGITLTVKRDDLLHPVISGNKWRKLKYALGVASKAKVQHIISFGGGFSNHLHALGYCCHHLNIQLTAIVRGNYSLNPTPMLLDLMSWQTDIQYVDRNTYQQRSELDYLQALQQQYPAASIIPEGGSQLLALQGVSEMIDELNNTYDYILAPMASGGTLAGLISGVGKNKTFSNCQILGIGVLKGEGYLEKLVADLLEVNSSQVNWQINHDFHFGGYGKSTNELRQFCGDFLQQTDIPIEPVYSGKLFWGIKALLNAGYFPENSRILALHTGGLQGAR
ncbi:MAG: pyridoxal-phosphate dependent enzyme [Paraglaciecola sp.]|uniref:1-aminocyclopropane-1-carboxylate deaminase/D-cysteine desulfhydrase n=1 Tax=Paraglaciecola sp. TaxID=1920173 RepID=UPI00329A2155